MTEKKNISGILQGLMAEPEAPKQRDDSPSFLTSLGIPLLKQEDGSHLIRLDDICVFRGITEFTGQLANQVLEESRAAGSDVLVRQVVSPEAMPEFAALGVGQVEVSVRSSIAHGLAESRGEFQRRLRLVFATLQSASWGGVLFPDRFGLPTAADTPPALLFPFHLLPEPVAANYLMLIEFERAGRFLRLTVEDAGRTRLNLKHIPHRVVANLEERCNLPESDRIADLFRQSIQQHWRNQQTECLQPAEQQPALFAHLVTAGLEGLTQITFRWDLGELQGILDAGPNELASLLARLLILLEDREIIKTIAGGRPLVMLAGGHRLFLDLSRGGVVLNISFERPRKRAMMQTYLDRLPRLQAVIGRRPLHLDKVRVFLVHHSTAEVLGLIQALAVSRCAAVCTTFIRYKSLIPDEHLEALGTLPADRFRFHALQKIETRDSVGGGYVISDQFSPLPNLAPLMRRFRSLNLDYLAAMRLLTCHLFFREVQAARRNGEKLLIVEDGGYLSPLLQEDILRDRTLADSLTEAGITAETAGADWPSPQERAGKTADWVAPVLLGGIEHTRNGHDALAALERKYGRLAYPNGSIALSDIKNVEEARECAASVLNAVESIFCGRGLLLSHRHVAVIGASGHIGAFVMKQLAPRLSRGTCCGIDIVPGENVYASFAALPEERLLDLDLFIGFVGKSVLDTATIEKLMLRGRRTALFFVSGSTKTAEYEDLSAWLQHLYSQPSPKIGDVPVSLEIAPVKDPQTGLVQGNRVVINFAGAAELPRKELYLLGDLMPLNFLYYGVPAEVIDQVMALLLRLSFSFIDKVMAGERLPDRLLGVDQQIDADANPLWA